tara:strand:- start:373 stop:771 length:399 start_codon:yes stop_codon:yes gene_type:complete
MNKENPIVCANGHHEDIILHFLAGVQNIIDEASIKDEDYDNFLNVLTKIIDVHNENGLIAFKDSVFRNDWYFSLPEMVYWACLGYLSSLTMEEGSLPQVLKKLHKRLRRTYSEIEIMILIYPHLEMDETYLN